MPIRRLKFEVVGQREVVVVYQSCSHVLASEHSRKRQPSATHCCRCVIGGGVLMGRIAQMSSFRQVQSACSTRTGVTLALCDK